jgi:hypothetical protein
LNVLSKRLAALEASLPPPPSQYAVATYCRGDDGFDAALAEVVEEERGKPGGITDQVEVFSVAVIKGLKGQAEDLTIILTVVDPKPEPSSLAETHLPETSQPVAVLQKEEIREPAQGEAQTLPDQGGEVRQARRPADDDYGWCF